MFLLLKKKKKRKRVLTSVLFSMCILDPNATEFYIMKQQEKRKLVAIVHGLYLNGDQQRVFGWMVCVELSCRGTHL